MDTGALVVNRLEAREPETRSRKERTFQESMAEYRDHALASTDYQACHRTIHKGLLSLVCISRLFERRTCKYRTAI